MNLHRFLPFDESDARRKKHAKVQKRRMLMAHALTQVYSECYCACRRHQRCQWRNRGFRYVSDFGAALGQATARLYLLSGVWIVKSNGGSKKYALIRVDDGVAAPTRCSSPWPRRAPLTTRRMSISSKTSNS